MLKQLLKQHDHHLYQAVDVDKKWLSSGRGLIRFQSMLLSFFDKKRAYIHSKYNYVCAHRHFAKVRTTLHAHDGQLMLNNQQPKFSMIMQRKAALLSYFVEKV